jgi:putative intracellular protease/amidase
VTGYSNEENSRAGPGDAALFTLESRLRDEGAKYHAGGGMSQFVITDGNLITSQNPPQPPKSPTRPSLHYQRPSWL